MAQTVEQSNNFYNSIVKAINALEQQAIAPTNGVFKIQYAEIQMAHIESLFNVYAGIWEKYQSIYVFKRMQAIQAYIIAKYGEGQDDEKQINKG